MSEAAEDAKGRVPQVDSIRYLFREGARIGTVSVVVGGVHYLWPCTPKCGAGFVEGLMEAVGKMES